MPDEVLRSLNDKTAIQSSSGTNNEKGNGLGLVICKELTELHGGKIDFMSNGTGTSARIIL